MTLPDEFLGINLENLAATLVDLDGIVAISYDGTTKAVKMAVKGNSYVFVRAYQSDKEWYEFNRMMNANFTYDLSLIYGDICFYVIRRP